jgi:galactokinase
MAAVTAGSFSLGDLAQSDAACPRQQLLDRFMAAGFDAAPAAEIQRMFQASARRLQRLATGVAADAAAKSFWVPGRIEVLGKHTDYAGGASLLGAVNKGFAVVTTARDDDKCRIFTQFSDGRELQQELALTPDTNELERLRACETDQGGWAAYPAAALQRLTSNFGITRGADISIECSLPEASGMSSSSAVICYMWSVLDAYNGISAGPHPTFAKSIGAGAEGEANLYTYLGNIENGKDFRPGQDDFTLHGMGGVGTFGGSEDHTAIMSCTKGELKMWSYCPTLHRRTVSVDPDVRFVIAVSGAKAEKTGGAMDDYNDACLLAFWAAAAYTQGRAGADAAASGDAISRDALAALFPGVALYNPNLPNLAECVRYERSANPGLDESALRAKVSDTIRSVGDSFKTVIPKMFSVAGLNCDGIASERIANETLVVRFEQFFDESETIVGAAAEAFAAHDYATLGRLVDDSHRFTVEKLKNTIPETAWLPQWARGMEAGAAEEEAKGADRVRALAASAFGAGFGGSCWALVRKDEADRFRDQWLEAYEARFPSKVGGLTREFFVMSPGPGSFQV